MLFLELSLRKILLGVWFEPVFKLVKKVMFRRAELRFLICDVAAVDVWMD